MEESLTGNMYNLADEKNQADEKSQSNDMSQTEEKCQTDEKYPAVQNSQQNPSYLSFSGYIKRAFKLPDNDIRTYSPLTLAFIGDSVFDLIIRTYVVESGNAPVNKLHHRCSKLVQAGAQAQLFHTVKDLLTEEEMAVFKRGRNAKSFTTAKNAGLLEYKTATGMEALIGYLYLTNRIDRIMELMQHHISSTDNEG
mgnify:FL=1